MKKNISQELFKLKNNNSYTLFYNCENVCWELPTFVNNYHSLIWKKIPEGKPCSKLISPLPWMVHNETICLFIFWFLSNIQKHTKIRNDPLTWLRYDWRLRWMHWDWVQKEPLMQDFSAAEHRVCHFGDWETEKIEIKSWKICIFPDKSDQFHHKRFCTNSFLQKNTAYIYLLLFE